ncbi:hypothetical protein DMENIID0001_013880 [Sergentomyia squamirostris]
MMEIFVVLGLCFVLYEALDLFEGCYRQYRHNGHLTNAVTDREDTTSNNQTGDDVEECKHLLSPSCEHSDCSKDCKSLDRCFIEDEKECQSGNESNVDRCTVFSVSECVAREQELSLI